MKLLNGFSVGINGFFKAISFIFKHNLWWTFAIPILLNIIFYSLGFSFTDLLSDMLSDNINTWINANPNSKIMKYIPSFLGVVTHILFQIIFFFIFSLFGGYLILICLSPLFAWLSERTDSILNNTNYPFSFNQFVSDIWRGIMIAIRNLFYELGISALILIATFIPFIGQLISPITFVLYFLVSAYFYGFSYIDYTNERNKLNLKQSVNFIRQHRGVAIANGSLFYLSLLIPFFGVLFSGLVGIVATVGATISIYDIQKKEAFKK